MTLSIVGLDDVPRSGYYAAKVRHEEAALAGPVPAVIVRATQFHEFAAQMIGWTRKGPFAFVPAMKVQTVAARTVGAELAAIAIDQQILERVEIGGPAVGVLSSLAKQIARARRRKLLILPVPVPGKLGKAVRAGALLPPKGARIVGPAFTEWLATPDAATPEF